MGHQTRKYLYGVKYAGLVWFEKLKKVLEDRGFVQSQLEPCLWYKEEMAPLFNSEYYPIFIPSNDTIDEVYASLQVDFNIEYDGELKKYLGIELYRRPDGSIHLRQP